MDATDPNWAESLGDVVTPGDVLAGKYRVERILGMGGMGVVVEAYHLQFDERVAVKFLLSENAPTRETVDRFSREARATYRIKSEHAARILDVGTLETGAPYLVMEFLEGQDLAAVLAERIRLPVQEAIEYVLQGCEAMAEAHAAGIIHRDLKPENLFLTKRPDGTPCIKVLDFGISKITGERSGKRERSLTTAGAVMGSPFYMAPEQWVSTRDVTAAADIWAVGAILYELVSGKLPFESPELATLCGMVLHDPVPPLSSVLPSAPPALEQALHRCLEKEAHDRYPSLAELVLDLAPLAPMTAMASIRRSVRVLQNAGMAPKSLQVPGGTTLPQESSPGDVEVELAETVPAGAESPLAQAEPPLAPAPGAGKGVPNDVAHCPTAAAVPDAGVAPRPAAQPGAPLQAGVAAHAGAATGNEWQVTVRSQTKGRTGLAIAGGGLAVLLTIGAAAAYWSSTRSDAHAVAGPTDDPTSAPAPPEAAPAETASPTDDGDTGPVSTMGTAGPASRAAADGGAPEPRGAPLAKGTAPQPASARGVGQTPPPTTSEPATKPKGDGVILSEDM